MMVLKYHVQKLMHVAIYRKIGWNEPQNGKKDIIRTSKRRKFKPDAPNQLWETDMTYIHCGIDGWCYCFNV